MSRPQFIWYTIDVLKCLFYWRLYLLILLILFLSRFVGKLQLKEIELWKPIYQRLAFVLFSIEIMSIFQQNQQENWISLDQGQGQVAVNRIIRLHQICESSEYWWYKLLKRLLDKYSYHLEYSRKITTKYEPAVSWSKLKII